MLLLLGFTNRDQYVLRKSGYMDDVQFTGKRDKRLGLIILPLDIPDFDHEDFPAPADCQNRVFVAVLGALSP